MSVKCCSCLRQPLFHHGHLQRPPSTCRSLRFSPCHLAMWPQHSSRPLSAIVTPFHDHTRVDTTKMEDTGIPCLFLPLPRTIHHRRASKAARSSQEQKQGRPQCQEGCGPRILTHAQLPAEAQKTTSEGLEEAQQCPGIHRTSGKKIQIHLWTANE